MKKDIHPSNYREVVFKDMSNEETFITRSTIATRETITIDGKLYNASGSCSNNCSCASFQLSAIP